MAKTIFWKMLQSKAEAQSPEEEQCGADESRATPLEADAEPPSVNSQVTD
jgi:hypothetical protein